MLLVGIESFEKNMGHFPVVSVRLKNVSGDSYSAARSFMCSVIGNEALPFYDVLINSTNLNDAEKALYRQLIAVSEMLGKASTTYLW